MEMKCYAVGLAHGGLGWVIPQSPTKGRDMRRCGREKKKKGGKKKMKSFFDRRC